jgi:hypothetical protein
MLDAVRLSHLAYSLKTSLPELQGYVPSFALSRGPSRCVVSQSCDLSECRRCWSLLAGSKQPILIATYPGHNAPLPQTNTLTPLLRQSDSLVFALGGVLVRV